MSDELTVRIAEVLAAHRAIGRGWHDTVWVCSAGCVVGVTEPGSRASKERTHQAEQVRAVLGETTTEWVALLPISGGVEEIAYQGMSEFTAREVGEVIKRREVTPWTEVPS